MGHLFQSLWHLRTVTPRLGEQLFPAKLWPMGMGVLWVLGKTSVGRQTEVPGKTMCLTQPQNIKVNRKHWLSPDFKKKRQSSEPTDLPK